MYADLMSNIDEFSGAVSNWTDLPNKESTEGEGVSADQRPHDAPKLEVFGFFFTSLPLALSWSFVGAHVVVSPGVAASTWESHVVLSLVVAFFCPLMLIDAVFFSLRLTLSKEPGQSAPLSQSRKRRDADGTALMEVPFGWRLNVDLRAIFEGIEGVSSLPYVLNRPCESIRLCSSCPHGDIWRYLTLLHTHTRTHVYVFVNAHFFAHSLTAFMCLFFVCMHVYKHTHPCSFS